MHDPIIFITELGGRMLWAAPSLEEQTGYGLADFQYENPDNPFIHPEDMPAVTAHFIAFAESDAEVSSEIENRFFTKWGEAVRYRSTLTKVVHEGIDAFQVECHRLDVEGQARAALIRSEARYRRLVETATDAIVRMDGAGHFLYSNPRFQSWVDRDAVGLRGERLVDLLAPEHREAADEAIAEAAIRRHSVRFEAQLVSSSGERRWIGARVIGLDDPDNPGSIQGILRDTTEAREVEQRLRQAQKMESLGLFAGGIAHDFNNLLTGILGNVSLAQRHPDSGVEAQLTAIRTAAERAASLTQSLLSYAGGVQGEHEPVDLNRLVAEVLPLARAAVTSRVAVDGGSASEPLMVMANTSQLTQVVLNLVTNAAEAHGGERGGVQVVTFLRDASALSEDGVWVTAPPTGEAFAVVRVRDHGSGIDPVVLERMFDPFFTTKGSSRGLGLSAVLGIVRSHGGGLKIWTESGEGSMLSVWLPTAVAHMPAAPHAVPQSHMTGAGRILVVDDEPMLLELAGRLLEHLGFEVELASGGSGAVALVRAHPTRFRLVLLDETMPGMSGTETMAALRALNAELPVLRTSGFMLDEVVSDRHTGFLAKPYTLTALERALEELLDG